MATTWENTTVRHGTQSGWWLHRKLKERPCDPCYNAKAEYDRNIKSAPNRVIMSRLAARAQAMSNKQLRHNHPAEYKALYAANKERLLAEHVKEIELAKTKIA